LDAGHSFSDLLGPPLGLFGRQLDAIPDQRCFPMPFVFVSPVLRQADVSDLSPKKRRRKGWMSECLPAPPRDYSPGWTFAAGTGKTE